MHLVNLDSTVDPSDEEICRIEANSASDQPESKHHQHCVAEVEQSWCELGDFQLQITHALVSCSLRVPN